MNLVFSELVPTQERTCEGRFNSSLARPLIVQLFDSSTQIPFAAFESRKRLDALLNLHQQE
jgi:hypothetical protein